MDENLKQSVLENAISSLKEGLAKYKNAVNLNGEETDQYKFAILHFTHFLELSLKHYILSIHPLLIYCNPFDERLGKPKGIQNVKTISIDEAVQFLKNTGIDMTSEFVGDLNFIKAIRNQIMHSKFSFNPDEADEKLGRLAKSFIELDEKFLDIELTSWLSEEENELFEKLNTNYLARLKKAKLAVKISEEKAYKGYRRKEYGLVNWNCYCCPECLESTLIPCTESETGYRCAFCGNEESFEIEDEEGESDEYRWEKLMREDL
jgi:hypothetical protein